MASHHDPYDPSSRSHDPPRSRSTFDSYLRPDAALAPTDRRSRSRSRARSPDSRNSYPPLLTPDAAGRLSHRSRSRSRRRSSWPPAPICEDEAASLAKEAGSQLLLKQVGKDEAVLRGAVDQEPIVLDLSEPKLPPKDTKLPAKSHSRSPSGYSNFPTPPPSDDEKARKRAPPPSRLASTGNEVRNDVPELGKRTSTPYSFSKDTGLAKDAPPKPRILSSDKFVSSPASERYPKATSSKSQGGTPIREAAKATPTAKAGNDYFSVSTADSAIDDTDADASDVSSRYSRRKPSTYPAPASSKPEPSKASSHIPTIDSAPPNGLAPPRRLNLDARRNTDVGSGSTPPNFLPTLNTEKTRRPTPLTTTTPGESVNPAIYASPTTHSTLDVPSFSARYPSAPSSRTVSPANSLNGKQRNTTPPETPRTSSEFIRDSSMDDSPISRNSSVSNSRPSSPSPRTPLDPSRFPKSDLDWSAVLAANSARRSKPTPRVAAIRQETMPTVSRDDNGQMPIHSQIPLANRSSSLPYPVDDGPSTPTVWMPAEQHHQFFPDSRPTIPYAPVASEPKSIPRTSTSGSSTHAPAYAYAPRASLSRQSTIDMPKPDKPSQPEKARPGEGKRVSSFINPSSAKKDLPTLIKKGLPECSRNRPVAGFNDWYCLTSTTSLHFCPDCIDHIDRTTYRLYFRRSPSQSSTKKVVCAFSTTWIQVAWILSLHMELTNVSLLEKIAHIDDSSEPCTGDTPSIQKWYGITDRDGYYVRDFYCCYNDVKKIEAVLPSVGGLFVPLPQRRSGSGTTYEKATCAIRPDGNRFHAYLGTLIAAHDHAQATRRAVDPTAFVELVKRRQRLRECPRDALFLNHMWHFIPSLPHFTVCEDCFETVVEPQIKLKSAVAMQFNRAVAPVYGSEGMGISCQLYSPRMRKAFLNAVVEEDTAKLAKKAKKRREAEMWLQDRYKAVMTKAKKLEREGAGEEEFRALEKEKRWIAEEWIKWE